MANALTELLGWVDARLRDGASHLSTTEKTAAAAQAIEAYSKHRPRRLTADIDGDGTYSYDLPSDWVQDWSVVDSIEYPAGEQRPVYLDPNDWTIYREGEVDSLRFLADDPGTGETARIGYTVRHVVTNNSTGSPIVQGKSTIPVPDQQAVADLAASYCLRQLASRQAQSVQPYITADSAAYGGASATYTALADRYLRQYRDHVGIGDGSSGGEVAAAVAFLDQDDDYPWGEDRLLHPRRWQ